GLAVLVLGGDEDPADGGGDHAATVGVAEDHHAPPDHRLADQKALVGLLDGGCDRPFTVAANLGGEDREHDTITVSGPGKNATPNFDRSGRVTRGARGRQSAGGSLVAPADRGRAAGWAGPGSPAGRQVQDARLGPGRLSSPAPGQAGA